MLISEKQILETLEKYKLQEQIVPVNRKECEILSKQDIYLLKNKDHFVIEAGILQDNKTKFTLSFGLITQSSIKRFRGSFGLFNNIHFNDVTIEDSAFNSVDFINCTFRDVTFRDTKAMKINFINCTFDNTKMTECTLDIVCFYHCIRDGLDLSEDIDQKSVVVYDASEDDTDTEHDFFDDDTAEENGGNLPPNDQTEEEYALLDGVIQNKQLFQYKIISLKNFYKVAKLDQVIFANCKFSFSSDLSRIIFNQCQFINCEFTETFSFFIGNNFIKCSFDNIEIKKTVISCVFDHCSINNLIVDEEFRNCHFIHCEYDDKEKYVRQMKQCEITPIEEIDRKIEDEKSLMAGYKNILMITIKEMENLAKNDSDQQLIENIMKLVRSIGSSTDYKTDLISSIKKASSTIPGKDLKDLVVYLQNDLFKRITT